jgi:hypothetical protein
MIDTDLKSTSGKTPRGWLRPIQTEIAAWSREDPASRVLAAVLFMFALFMLWSMAVIQRRGYSALPWWDMWDYWVWYLKPHPAPLLNLFAQHNEHRIAVARLFFLADQGFFQGRAIFIFVSIFLIQFCHAILLWRLAYLAHPHRKTLSVFLGSAALLCLFSAEQYTNFTWSFQIQFVVVYFAVTGALTSLLVFARLCDEGAATNESRRWFWLGIAILVGIIATYSMANGLLVWPVLLLLALWFRLPRPVKGVLLLVGVAMWTLYLWGYKSPPQTSSIRDGFHNLPQSFVFAMCVLGSPLNDFVFEIDRIFSMGGEQWQLVWTAAAGLIGFTASALLWIVFGRNRRDTSRADAVILHLLLFLVATTALIGLGRSNAPLRDALHSRYTTVRVSHRQTQPLTRQSITGVVPVRRRHAGASSHRSVSTDANSLCPRERARPERIRGHHRRAGLRSRSLGQELLQSEGPDTDLAVYADQTSLSFRARAIALAWRSDRGALSGCGFGRLCRISRQQREGLRRS